MKNITKSGFGLIALVALSGCGGAGAGTGLESFSNLLALDGGELVGISRATGAETITVEQTHTRTFEDRTIGGRPGGLSGRPGSVGGPGGPPRGTSRWNMSQGVGRAVKVSVPEGAVLPASFTLSNIAMSMRVTDGERVAERTTTIAGPVTLTRSGESSTYTASAELTPEASFTEGSFETLHAILTTAPSPNTATATLRYDASAELPAGAKLRFGLERGHARMQ
ncbi:hypothetical protein [Armatimonas sp.]|uniref:hypothetical protein n=1 Tax=Armatimonas sp. TaxID=1872638 RepID=UPI002869F595|nr:hypothetical protein [Armatimonas sp.]